MKKNINVLSVFGTRPEAIKMLPLAEELSSRNTVNHKICVTAQHREMLDQVLDFFNVVPDFDLDIMSVGQNLSDVTANVLNKIEEVFITFKPDVVLVHGDTTTSFATSLAAFYNNIPVAHIEAGLRTYDLQKPFPEEFNRQITSKIAKLHFSPTEQARKNLTKENIDENSIWVTGNTVVDALLKTVNKIKTEIEIKQEVIAELDNSLGFNWQIQQFVLITGHRRENFGNGIIEICDAIWELASLFPDIQWVYPVHPNPKVQEPVNRILGKVKNIHLIRPLPYQLFTYLLSKCYFVMTDSGGIQEEAPVLGKPVLIFRDSTERPEAVLAGAAKLLGSNKQIIIRETSALLTQPEVYSEMAKSRDIFGDGSSSRIITDVIVREIS